MNYEIILFASLVVLAALIIASIRILLNELKNSKKVAIPRIMLSRKTPYFLFLLFVANYAFSAAMLATTIVTAATTNSAKISSSFDISDLVAFFYAFTGFAFILYVIKILRSRSHID
ncbi:MAG: hypothetical protein QXP36_08845 [Conexivisphaerales archaeon]